MTARATSLFVGVGNVLRRDDGVGVYAAERMAARALPPCVEVYDAGTAGGLAAGVLDRRDRVVVVDGIGAGVEPGAIFRLTPEQLRPFARTGLSLHDAHLLDALDECRLLGTAPRNVTVLAVQVADVGPGIGLSPAVARSLERVVDLAAQELGISEDACLSKGGVPNGAVATGVSGDRIDHDPERFADARVGAGAAGVG